MILLTLVVSVAFLFCCIMLITVVAMLILPTPGQGADTLEVEGKVFMCGFGLILAAGAFWSGNWLFFSNEKVSQPKKQDTVEEYDERWRSDAPRKIVQTLTSNNVRGCGEFHYRPSAKNSGEYLVYCTSDGRTWSAYLVWPDVDRISGPAKPDPSIDLPR